MYKSNILNFHKKYPFVEPIFLFLLGIFVGAFINLFTGKISSGQIIGWQILRSKYFWITVFFLFFGIIYYWKFSSFAITRKNTSTIKAGDTIIDTLTKELTKMLEKDDPIAFKQHLPLVRETIQVIKEVDKELIGGISYEK